MSASLSLETGIEAERAKRVVISPFANERVREWPTAHFRRLIEIMTGNKAMRVFVVGTQGQRARGNELVRGFSALQVVNACGRLKWHELERLIDSAGCIITNNSGIGHTAAKRGAWTLCIFAASHSWLEWMPRGPRVVLITRMTACAPCELGTQSCPNAIACMIDLTPQAVYDRFLDIQSRLAEEDFRDSIDDNSPIATQDATQAARAGR